MKKRILCLMLILLLICPAFAEEHYAVIVGGDRYTTKEVQHYIDTSAVSLQIFSGVTVASAYEDPEEFFLDCCEHFVTLSLYDAVLRDRGIVIPSEEEDTLLRTFAQEQYESIWQEFRTLWEENYPEDAFSERDVTELMESAGYSMDDFYAQAVLSLREQKLIELFCGDITFTEGEARAYYEENAVAPYRERYEHDVASFERESLLSGESAPYIPEGYYYIKYVIFEPDEEHADRLSDTRIALSDAEDRLQACYDALAQAAIDDTGTKEAREAYEQALRERDEAAAAVLNLNAETEELYEPMYELIRSEMEEGCTFEEMIGRYSDEPSMESTAEEGYPFHPESVVWDEHLIGPVSALKRYGEITHPVCTGTAVYIVCRMDDLKCGSYVLSEEEAETVRTDVLKEMQLSRLQELAEGWREGADITIDTTGLAFPQ